MKRKALLEAETDSEYYSDDNSDEEVSRTRKFKIL